MMSTASLIFISASMPERPVPGEGQQIVVLDALLPFCMDDEPEAQVCAGVCGRHSGREDKST